MFDTPATRDVRRAKSLEIATLAQKSLDLEDPADLWHRQGVRDDAHAYAAELLRDFLTMFRENATTVQARPDSPGVRL